MSHRSHHPLLRRLSGMLLLGCLFTTPANGSSSILPGPATVAQASGITQDLLQPKRLYNRIGRPIPVVLSLRGRTVSPEGGFDLVLIDTDGTVLDSANGGMPGEFDLIAALPAIADLEQALAATA